MNSLDALGVLRIETAGYREAEKSLLEAIALAERLSEQKALLASALDHLASLYNETGGRKAEVESLLRRALETALAGVGIEPRQIGVHYSHLAQSLIERRKLDEAEEMLQRALRLIDERRFPAFIADMYDSLGAVAYYRGKGPEALTLFDRASRLFQEAGGPESPGLVLSLISAGTVYLKMDRAAEAESALARAEEIAVKAYGPEHPRVAEALTLGSRPCGSSGSGKRPAGPSNASAIAAARSSDINAISSRIHVSDLASQR
jgi:tetratricopeptide (TPR) repeat protein